jgi:peptidoglycan pentaglycine glycine transferase (the first glycine)
MAMEFMANVPLEKKFVTSQPAWDQTLLTLPNAHILQSWDWGEFKSRWGWSAQRLLWSNAGRPVAAAQILNRPIPRTPWRFLYVTKGPAFDYTNIELAQKILTDLEEIARQTRALFIKIDPDVVRRYGEPQPDTVDVAEGQMMQNLLSIRGWYFSPEQIQFRNTVLVDLTPTTSALLAAMKSKWRYNIRLAERKGVVIRRGDKADIPFFYHMYAQTAVRDGFLIRPEAYYTDVWQRFLAAGRAEMLLAEVENEVVAGLILFIFGPTAWYMYGASTGRHRQLMPNHLLQWQTMCRAKEQGCTCYDMWGAPDVFDETDRLGGVYRFKQGFGGQVVQGLGAYDYPANRPLYWAFTHALPRLRSIMRQLKK